MIASHTPPTGVPACNRGMCPDWELNQQPFDSQAGTESTEPHQPGQLRIFLKYFLCYPFPTSLLLVLQLHIYNPPEAVPELPDAIFHPLKLFFLFCFILEIPNVKSLSSLIFSSALSNLQLIRHSVFFISNLVIFILRNLMKVFFKIYFPCLY